MIVKQARRNLMASKLRLALTSLAIVLGVGFVAGAFVLGDTLNRAFDNVFAAANEGVSVQVRGVATVSDLDREPVPASVLDDVRRVDGVAAAEGSLFGQAQIIGKDGEPAGISGPPALGFGWVDNEDINPLSIREGQPPRAPGDVVIDAKTADDEGFVVGDRVTIISALGPAEYTVTGIVVFGDDGELAGATLAAFAPATAQRIFKSEGVYETIEVAAEPGVADADLARRVGGVLPDGYEAITGEQATEDASEQFKQFIDIFRNALLVFAGVALFVGAFIILNAFQITIAQRRRQIGLLRAVGASSGQVVASVLLEALIIGVAASVVGLLFGIGVAWLLQALFNALGASLPETGFVVNTRTIVVSLAVGIIVTMVAAAGPAVRASSVPPLAALRDVTVTGRHRLRLAVSVLLTVLGIALVLQGTLGDLDTGPRFTALGVGAMLLFIGAAMLTRYVARPLAAVIGVPIAFIGRTPGRLGRGNAMRNPGRTAQTASALTIGVALVAAVTIFAASLSETFIGTLDNRVKADVIVLSSSQTPFSSAAADALRGEPRLSTSTAWRTGQFKDAADDVQDLQGVDPTAIGRMYDPGVIEGDMDDLLQTDTIAVYEDYAKDNDLQVGDTVSALFAKTGRRPLRVVAVFEDNSFGQFFVSLNQFQRDFTTQEDIVLLARGAEGVSPEEAKAAVEERLQAFPNLDVRTKAEYRDWIAGQIDQFLRLFYVLLAMAVVIAIFGIILTLALSVFERTREIGLLRAVGMSRKGARQMIRWEAVIVALIGAVVGLALGVFLGVVAVEAVPDLKALAIPWVSLVIFLVLAGLFGVLAAILPARRAARLNVLEAIQSE